MINISSRWREMHAKSPHFISIPAPVSEIKSSSSSPPILDFAWRCKTIRLIISEYLYDCYVLSIAKLSTIVLIVGSCRLPFFSHSGEKDRQIQMTKYLPYHSYVHSLSLSAIRPRAGRSHTAQTQQKSSTTMMADGTGMVVAWVVFHHNLFLQPQFNIKNQ